jgi:hypothetical protein
MTASADPYTILLPTVTLNHREFEPPLDERIEDLKHRLRVEAAVVEGAKNVIKLLQNGSKDKSDKKLLSE